MLVKDLIEKLKNMPADADVTINYVYSSDDSIWNVSCSEDIADVVFDKHSKTVDLMTKDYKED